MKAHGIGKKEIKIKRYLDSTRRSSSRKLVICVDNEGYPASLERRKIYRALRDNAAAGHGMIRVVDESGEDYLFPEKLFVPVELPKPVERALMRRG